MEEALKDANRLADAARAASDRTRWAEAIKTAEGAQQRCCESGVRDETLRHRVADASGGIPEEGEGAKARERDRRLVAALGEARLRGTAEAREGGYDLEAIIAAYQRAFREYGIDIGTLPPARAAELIRAKAARDSRGGGGGARRLGMASRSSQRFGPVGYRQRG